MYIHSFWRVLHYIKKTLKAEENFSFFASPSICHPPNLYWDPAAQYREKVFHISSRPCCCVHRTRSFPYCQWMEMVEGVTYVTSIIRRGTWWGVHPPHLSPLPLWQHHPAYHQRARETVYIVKNKEPIDSHYTRAQQETLRPPGVSVYFSMRIIIYIVGIYKVALNEFFFLLHLFLYTVSPNWMLFAHCSM